MDAENIRVRVTSYFAQASSKIVAAYLFGSFGRGTSGEHSDVDIAVLFREAPERALDGPRFRVRGELEKLLRRRVDVIVLNDASPDLSHRILRDGVLTLDRDRNFRLLFEVKKRNEYLDFLPVLKLYRRYPRDRVVQ